MTRKETSKDNTTLDRKASLRRAALRMVGNPVILETHAGLGEIYKKVYRGIPYGIALEIDGRKAARLAMQRPTWRVYMADCEAALRAGLTKRVPINYLDLDPYGDPWIVLDAFIDGHQPEVERLVVVVNDGMRRKVQQGGAYHTKSLHGLTQKFGNRLYAKYLTACEYMMQEYAARAGYRLTGWHGYYTGHNDVMTHYVGIWTRRGLVN